MADESPFSGKIKIDESYFGDRRMGKRGCGAAVKVAVFGILKRGGHVYTAVLPDLKRRTLEPIIRERVRLKSVVYTDSFPAYDKLDVAGFKHYRINQLEGFADYNANGCTAPINGIENIWNRAKRRLSEYNGIPTCHFELFLKECERPFNYGSPRALLATQSEWHPI